jgi:hypothetical protein
VEAGLVDGRKLFVDASLIDADASNNSVVDTHSLKSYRTKGYRQLERKLDELTPEKTTPANSRYRSSTDPDASVTRHSSGTAKLRYKTHRAVDPHNEVITATGITPGSTDDGEMLKEMIDTHKDNTHTEVKTVVADTKIRYHRYLPPVPRSGAEGPYPFSRGDTKRIGEQERHLCSGCLQL